MRCGLAKIGYAAAVEDWTTLGAVARRKYEETLYSSCEMILQFILNPVTGSQESRAFIKY